MLAIIRKMLLATKKMQLNWRKQMLLHFSVDMTLWRQLYCTLLEMAHHCHLKTYSTDVYNGQILQLAEKNINNYFFPLLIFFFFYFFLISSSRHRTIGLVFTPTTDFVGSDSEHSFGNYVFQDAHIASTIVRRIINHSP